MSNGLSDEWPFKIGISCLSVALVCVVLSMCVGGWLIFLPIIVSLLVVNLGCFITAVWKS